MQKVLKLVSRSSVANPICQEGKVKEPSRILPFLPDFSSFFPIFPDFFIILTKNGHEYAILQIDC